MIEYEHKDWPRDLIHKENGARKEFKRPEDVPPGWFTVDGEEVNPENEPEAQDDASEQALRDIRGRGSDPKPRGKGRKRGHPKSDERDPGVQDGEDAG